MTFIPGQQRHYQCAQGSLFMPGSVMHMAQTTVYAPLECVALQNRGHQLRMVDSISEEGTLTSWVRTLSAALSERKLRKWS